MCAGEDDVVVAAAGVAVSTDGGATFGRGAPRAWRTEGLAHRYCTAVVRSGAALVIGSLEGPFGETVLYRGALDSGAFERTGTDLPTAEPVLARQLLEATRRVSVFQGRNSTDGRTWATDA